MGNNAQFEKGRPTFICEECGKRTRRTAVNGNTDLCPKCYREAEALNAEDDGDRLPPTEPKAKGLAATDWTGTIHYELLQIKGRYARAEAAEAEKALRTYMAQHEWSQADIDWAIPRVMGQRVAGSETIESSLKKELPTTKRKAPRKPAGKPGVVEFRLREVIVKILGGYKGTGLDIELKAKKIPMHFGVSYLLSVEPQFAQQVRTQLVQIGQTSEHKKDKRFNEAIERIDAALEAAGVTK